MLRGGNVSWLLSLGVISLVACGGVRPLPRMGLSRERLVLQSVAGARHEDALSGLELVSSAHGELVARDATGTRARRRFGYVTTRVAGRFVGSTRFVVVSSADDGGRAGFANPRDPFGMSSGMLVRWDVTTDTVTALAPAPSSDAVLCRADSHVIALHEGQLVVIGADAYAPSGQQAEELVEDAGRCFVRRGTQWLVASLDADLAIVTSSAPRSPSTHAADAEATDQAFVERIEWAGIAPSADIVAVASREQAYVLSSEGARSLRAPHPTCTWHSNGLLACGAVLVPIDVTTTPASSLLEEEVRSVADADEWSIPAIAAYRAWRATAAAATGADIPPWPIEPVCSQAPRACVRAHLTGTSVDGWELFDPAMPGVVRARLPNTLPPGAGYVYVSPGGRFVRETTAGVAIHATDPADRSVIVGVGSWTGITSGWAELPSGWVVVDPDDHHLLRALRHSGPAVERRFDVALGRISVIDAGLVFVHVPREGGDEGHVIDVATLESTRVISLGTSGNDGVLRCRGTSVVRADGSVVERACPTDALTVTEAGSVAISASGAFWLDARRLDQIVIHRASDDATLTVTLFADGAVASTSDGAFEIVGNVDPRTLGLVQGTTWESVRVEPPGAPSNGLVRAFFAPR